MRAISSRIRRREMPLGHAPVHRSSGGLLDGRVIVVVWEHGRFGHVVAPAEEGSVSVEHHSRSTSRTSETARALPHAPRPPRGAHYFRRVAMGTIMPGAGLLATRWRLLGWVMVSGAVLVGTYLAARIWEGGIFRSALEVAVQPVLLQRTGVVLMVGSVLWMGSIVLTAQQSWGGADLIFFVFYLSLMEHHPFLRQISTQ